ncbi:MAG: metal ABC transporter ATP-binding protein [Actinomycetia bacterium]|nr:metal ABC transporter ATP-binding protein [Actinomycetes bacterium]
MAVTKALLTLRGVTVRYGAHRALNGVDLTLGRGTSTALVGSNGSGKTTLLELLAGLLAPSAGDIDLPPDGRPRVGLVQQRLGAGGWLPLTVGEILRMGRYRERGLLGRITGSDRRLVADAAERLEVADLGTRQFGELSGGQQQRVLVAQALAGEPELLLLDEPLTGLDIASQTRIIGLVEELAAAGTTVVLSTHHLEEARACQQVVLLAGRVVASGTPTEVLAPENLREAFAGRVLETDHGIVIDDHGHGDHSH